MRYNPDRPYDEKVYDLEELEKRLLPEFLFRQFVNKIAREHQTLTAFYWVVDFIAQMFPEEITPARATALKKIAHKVFVIYDNLPPAKTITALLHKDGVPVKKIAKTLGVKPPTIYYYLKQEIKLPTQAMLTYGEYDLMLDFMDCWNKVQPEYNITIEGDETVEEPPPSRDY